MLVGIFFREISKRILVIEDRHPLNERTITHLQTHLGIVAFIKILRISEFRAVRHLISRCHTKDTTETIDRRFQIISAHTLTILFTLQIEATVKFIQYFRPAV